MTESSLPKKGTGRKQPTGKEIMRRRTPDDLSLRPARFEFDPKKAYTPEQLAHLIHRCRHETPGMYSVWLCNEYGHGGSPRAAPRFGPYLAGVGGWIGQGSAGHTPHASSGPGDQRPDQIAE